MNAMRERTACFTGHRKIMEKDSPLLREKIRSVLIESIERGYCYFGAGGALGFDTIAAQTVLDLRNQYPSIKLILVLPCLSQTKGWKTEDIMEYERIKASADKVVYTSQEYHRGCMHKRNRHLVDNSSLCICYLTEHNGGTAYTVNYAKEKALMIVNVAEM